MTLYAIINRISDDIDRRGGPCPVSMTEFLDWWERRISLSGYDIYRRMSDMLFPSPVFLLPPSSAAERLSDDRRPVGAE